MCPEDEIVKLTITSSPQSRREARWKKKGSLCCAQNFIGSDWMVELDCLQQSTTIFEAAASLKRINLLLDQIEPANIAKSCKDDFCAAVSQLESQNLMFSDELLDNIKLVKSRFWKEGPLERIPADVIQEIFTWLPIDDFGPIASVCSEWQKISVSDGVWQTFYHYRFLRHNPNTLPHSKSNYLAAFRTRLANPQTGDKVEVAWRGKFRLEALDVYQGLAWWVAEVVDKHASQGKYKIRYPGWEKKWDEWVPRSRLRWAVDKNEIAQIQANDAVELWCCGANVPGAWLESHVKKSRDGRYCVGRVLSTGSLWVARDRLRLVKHIINRDSSGSTTTETPPQRSPSIALLESVPSIGNQTGGSPCYNRQQRYSCNIM